MDTPRLYDAMAALVSALQAAPGLTGVTASLTNPDVAGTTEFVLVGHDGSLNPDGSLSTLPEAGTFTSKFITMGYPAEQEEIGTIYCVVVAQGGGDDIGERMSRAQAILGAVGTAITDLQVGDIKFDSPGFSRLFTRFNAQGIAAEFVFNVTYKTPLGP